MPRELVVCNLCGSEDYVQIYEGNIQDTTTSLGYSCACTTTALGRSGPIVRCSNCGLVYMNPRPDLNELLEGYSSVVDTAYIDERPAKAATFRRQLEEIEHFAPAQNSILDIGAHVGTFLEVAQERGWKEVHGVEPSSWATDVARSTGLDVRCGTLKDAAFPAESFDAATLWDVIEHFTDPVSELREVNRVLRRGGVLGICTMNRDSWTERVLRRRWPWYMESHLYYFSPRSLSRMAASAGFKTVAIKSHPHSTRVVSFVDRLSGWFPPAGIPVRKIVQLAGWEEKIITIDFGDFFTLFAIKQ